MTLEVDPGSCSTPCGSETGRAFLQERLALFGKVVFLLSLGFYVVVNALHFLGHPDNPLHFVSCGHNYFHAASTLVVGSMWLFAATARQPCHAHLRYVDAAGTFLVCSLYALTSLTSCEPTSGQPGILALVNTLVARAILVPSEPRTTWWLGVAASVPTIAVSYALLAGPDAIRDPATPVWVATAYQGLWCVVAVVVSTVTSRVIYGLQREVREARRLGQYTLEEKIGAGGMGEVFRASHSFLRRPTAIKLLRRETAGEKSIARFEREVQLTSRLTHPNTIAIYDYGRTPDGVFYYAMEFLPGITLDDLVHTDGPQPHGRTIHILRQVCASLTEAHGIGLIHRDIKAANVILCERGGVYDVAKVVDFGLVKEVESVGGISLSGANIITGTPTYLSPESIRTPERVDGRTDIYSLGVLAYYLVTGQHVFEGENFLEICGHHLHTRPVPPSLRTSCPVPGDLETVILSCLEKDPAGRPGDVRTLSLLLGRCRDAGAWDERKAEAWWRGNEARVRRACGKSPPTATESPHPVALETVVLEPSGHAG